MDKPPPVKHVLLLVLHVLEEKLVNVTLVTKDTFWPQRLVSQDVFSLNTLLQENVSTVFLDVMFAKTQSHVKDVHQDHSFIMELVSLLAQLDTSEPIRFAQHVIVLVPHAKMHHLIIANHAQLDSFSMERLVPINVGPVNIL